MTKRKALKKQGHEQKTEVVAASLRKVATAGGPVANKAPGPKVPGKLSRLHDLAPSLTY